MTSKPQQQGSSPPAPGRHNTAADTAQAVDAFMLALAHPFKAEVQQIRALVLSAAPGIAEGIKWQAPSFRTHGYFATVNLREKAGVGVILHLGAKAPPLAPGGLVIPDPHGLLVWLAGDRAMVRFANAGELQSKAQAFQQIVQAWVRHV